MFIKRIFFATLLMFFNNACKKENTESPELIQANKIHLESIRIHKNVETEIIEKKQNAITNKNLALVQKLDSLKIILDFWEDGIVEVPGFAHEHHHEKGEHHEHKAEIKMTDESMLEYQKNSKQAIEELQKALKENFK